MAQPGVEAAEHRPGRGDPRRPEGREPLARGDLADRGRERLAFNKDDPTDAIGTLNKLGESYPKNAEIFFHLGLLEFWIKQGDSATALMRQAVAADPTGPYSAAAKVFITCLTSPSGSACKNLQS